MVDELEEKPGEGPNLQQYVGVIRRRRLLFLIPFFLGWLVVWTASWVLPARYKSGTLILVEQPTMPKDYVPPNATYDLQELLATMTQQILSRTRLLHIIKEFNLYADKRSPLNEDESVEHMRKDIDIEPVRDERRQITSFNIYYSSRDPHVAKDVTYELANLFINKNLDLQMKESEGTTKFLQDQLETAHQNLVKQEGKVRVFKDQHEGALPTDLQSNIQILSGLQSQLQNEEAALSAARGQNAYLQSMVEQAHASLRGTKPAENAPDELAALNQELDKLNAQLRDLRSHYTESYPDVRKLEGQVAETEEMRDHVLANPKPGAPNLDSRVGAEMAQVEGQLKANQIEIENKERDIANLNSQINDYRARLKQTPAIEQQFADLNRDYDQSKENYDELLKKKNSSQMSTDLVRLQQGTNFQMIDPPSLPLKPDFPNRIKMSGIGLGVGLAFGTLLVGGTEYLDDRLHDEKGLKQTIPVTVISDIPVISSQDEERRQRRRLWLTWALAGLVFASILAGSAISFLRG
jgi:succinoglycan biosynthesis transport protein ExoP